MDDNLYPNQGAAFSPLSVPVDQRRANDEEINETFQAVPLLKEIVERLDRQIAFYNSLDAVPSESLTNPEEFMHIVAANKLTIENLDIERSYILERVENALK